jgi:hypothetical protein
VGHDGGQTEVLSLRLPGQVENNHEKTRPGLLVFRPRFEHNTSEVQNVTATLGMTFITKGEFRE